MQRRSDDSPTDGSAELLRLLASSDDAVVLTDVHGRVDYANAAAGDPRGLVEAVRRQIPRELLSATEAHWRGEVPLDGTDTTIFDVQVTKTGDTMAIVGRDVTATVRLQSHLGHLATHDGLTGLANRGLFLRRLTEAITSSRTRRSSVAVLFIDIDNLKWVNDSIDHDGGDQLIAGIGQRISAATRPHDLVARISGDEFVVLCEGIPDEDTAIELAERVRLAVSGPMQIREVTVDASVSVGVAVLHGADEEKSASDAALALVRDSSQAMFRVKTRGKSRDATRVDSVRPSASLRSDVVREHDSVTPSLEDLFVAYQPIVSLHSRRLAGAEALVRWHHPDGRDVEAAAFFDRLADTEARIAIGKWVLGQALADLRSWIDTGRVDRQFVMHVNVFPDHVGDTRFIEDVTEALDASACRPEQLALDITEGAILDVETRAVRTLLTLERAHVRVSIDDFGTGASSLRRLRDCPADFVKLDGSLTRDLGAGDDDEPLVRSIIQFAHSVDMTVIAEWVTNDGQIDRLRALGCDLVQGFHIAEPMPAPQFAHWTATVWTA